ncbi:MAG: DUF2298 domain-containing protein [Saccharofermentans sp.]|jgi:YYY domain-containing protein|nr:DUF2298 domain-containing protein [Mageeibacillus sp.]MCI1264226.1 DUF2298 domain-containing protein [Saccharofermentans sp.]MCI1274977.1 DUF2298 domain-containing protein [Saccharofermentans sp.]MCI2044263.1 DUF2298 domain-containing protein [Mageeibacillus sp.]
MLKFKSANLAEATVFEAPIKALLFLVPFIALIFTGLLTMGATDTIFVLRWVIVLLALNLSVLPFATRLFRSFGSGGFILSQTLGIVFVSALVWTLTYIGIYRFTLPLVIAAIIAVAATGYGVKPLRKGIVEKVSEKYYLERIIVEQTLFTVMLTLMCYFKGFLPNINGQEKFMDYGFIVSMLRNPSLPATDMWLAGNSINYYYFGQFMWALVIKVSAITPEVGYNLAMCSATAIPFAMCFSLGTMLIEGSEKFGFHRNTAVKYLTGLLTGLSVSIWGNSHSFFYDPDSLGNSILSFFAGLGAKVGTTDTYFFPDSTRYIGWNPEVTTNGGDYTIEEFPFYSYLVGDLHAHVISMMIVLLIIAVILSLVVSSSMPDNLEKSIRRSRFNLSSPGGRLTSELKVTLKAEFIVVCLLLGVAQMTNYWDFLIYFIFCSMAVFIINTRTSRNFFSIPGIFVFTANVAGILAIYLKFGSIPILLAAFEGLLAFLSYLYTVYDPSALTRTSFQMSVMFTLSSLVALPFNLNFNMISNSLGAVKNRSSLFQLFILWGTHVIICTVFLIAVIINRNYKLATAAERRKRRFTVSVNEEPAGGYTNPVARFFGERNLIDVFVCGMTVVGILLLIAPEIFYVRDIYTSGYLRSNTMFKFAFAAFIILSIAMSYAVFRMFWIVNRKGVYSTAALALSIVFLLFCFVPAHYTVLSLKQRCGELTKENYHGLNGIDYLDTYSSQYSYIPNEGGLKSYADAIDWLNANVSGVPVICEAYGNSYTDNCIVSSYTGLPTVIGWQTHEWLWRFHGIVDKSTDTLVSDPDDDVWQLYITPRHTDVDIVYLSANTDEIQAIINKYHIEYIILGNLEYFQYNYDNTETLKKLGQVVFTSENLNIFKVTPASAS